MTFGTGVRYRAWTEQDEATFVDLAARRVSTRAIGRTLGRTMNALHLKASRLGIVLRSPKGRPRKYSYVLPRGRAGPGATGLAPPSDARVAFDVLEEAFDAAAGVGPSSSGRSMSVAPRQRRRRDRLSPCPFILEDS